MGRKGLIEVLGGKEFCTPLKGIKGEIEDAKTTPVTTVAVV